MSSTLFCFDLSKWTVASQLPSSFTKILLLTVSLEKTKSSWISSCTGARVQLLGTHLLFFFLSDSFFWIDLGRILWAIKPMCFPLNEIFFQFMDMDFLERVHLGNADKDYKSFPTTTNLISLAAVAFNPLAGPWGCVHLQLQQRLGDARLKIHWLLAVGLHHLRPQAQHGFPSMRPPTSVGEHSAKKGLCKTFKPLEGRCRDLLILQLPKTSLLGKFY